MPSQLEKKLDYLEAVSETLSEPTEEDMNSALGTIGLGAISPLHIAFQVG